MSFILWFTSPAIAIAIVIFFYFFVCFFFVLFFYSIELYAFLCVFFVLQKHNTITKALLSKNKQTKMKKQSKKYHKNEQTKKKQLTSGSLQKHVPKNKQKNKSKKKKMTKLGLLLFLLNLI